MTGPEPETSSGHAVPGGGAFPETRWSVVAAAGSDRTVRARALERLCGDYWQPLYLFMRGRGCSIEDAKDLTQTLLAGLVERDAFDGLSAEAGRFRTYLLRCAKNLIASEWHAGRALKRGGGAEHVSIDTAEGEASLAALRAVADQDGASPDVLYDRQWSAQLLRRVMEQVAERFRASGQEDRFSRLWPLVAAAEDRGRYRALAAELGVSEPALRMMVFRLRHRFRALLRDEIAQTVADPAEIDDEINHLMTLYRHD